MSKRNFTDEELHEIAEHIWNMLPSREARWALVQALTDRLSEPSNE